MRRRSALGLLRRISSETTDLFEQLASTSERTAERTSEALFGVLGGGVGLGGSYILSITIKGFLFALGGPIAAAVCIPGAILMWRGRRWFRLERELREHRILAEEMLANYKSLPKNTPADIKAKMLQEYLELVVNLRERVAPRIEALHHTVSIAPNQDDKTPQLPPPEKENK